MFTAVPTATVRNGVRLNSLIGASDGQHGAYARARKVGCLTVIDPLCHWWLTLHRPHQSGQR